MRKDRKKLITIAFILILALFVSSIVSGFPVNLLIKDNYAEAGNTTSVEGEVSAIDAYIEEGRKLFESGKYLQALEKYNKVNSLRRSFLVSGAGKFI